jgi:hypothetical protein
MEASAEVGEVRLIILGFSTSRDKLITQVQILPESNLWDITSVFVLFIDILCIRVLNVLRTL